MKRLTGSVFLIVILVGAFVVSSSFVSPVDAVVDVIILSDTGFVDSSGRYHVVGEIQNTGDEAVTHILIEATFYGRREYIDYYIGENSTWVELDVLLVGRKSPFEIILFNTTQSAEVDYYFLNPCKACIWTTSPLPMGLEILSNSSYIDDVGRMHIIGEIKNIGNEKATYVKVIATYYDVEGKVVDAEFNYSDPMDIKPGWRASFSITLSSERVPYVARYGLTAESTQYAIVREAHGAEAASDGVEFPTWVLIPLILIVLIVAIAIYRRRRLHKRSIRRK